MGVYRVAIERDGLQFHHVYYRKQDAHADFAAEVQECKMRKISYRVRIYRGSLSTIPIKVAIGGKFSNTDATNSTE